MQVNGPQCVSAHLSQRCWWRRTPAASWRSRRCCSWPQRTRECYWSYGETERNGDVDHPWRGTGWCKKIRELAPSFELLLHLIHRRGIETYCLVKSRNVSSNISFHPFLFCRRNLSWLHQWLRWLGADLAGHGPMLASRVSAGRKIHLNSHQSQGRDTERRNRWPKMYIWIFYNTE